MTSLAPLCQRLHEETNFHRDVWGIAFGVLASSGHFTEDDVIRLGFDYWRSTADLFHPVELANALVVLSNASEKSPHFS